MILLDPEKKNDFLIRVALPTTAVLLSVASNKMSLSFPVFVMQRDGQYYAHINYLFEYLRVHTKNPVHCLYCSNRKLDRI